MYQVLKRDGGTVDFDIAKISSAMTKAFDALEKLEAVTVPVGVVLHDQAPQGGAVGLLHYVVVSRGVYGVVIVDDDVLPVGGHVDVGLNAPVGTVACGHKARAGVAYLQMVDALMADHADGGVVFFVEFDSIHRLLRLK